MTAPVTVTQADIYAADRCFDFIDPAEQADAVARVAPIFARYRQQAEAPSDAQVAELREALGWALGIIDQQTGFTPEAYSQAFNTYTAARTKSASEAEGEYDPLDDIDPAWADAR